VCKLGKTNLRPFDHCPPSFSCIGKNRGVKKPPQKPSSLAHMICLSGPIAPSMRGRRMYCFRVQQTEKPYGMTIFPATATVSPLREPSRHYGTVSFLKSYDITCYSRTTRMSLPFFGPHLEVLALYMFVFAVFGKMTSIFSCISCTCRPERRPMLEISPMSRPTGKWEGSPHLLTWSNQRPRMRASSPISASHLRLTEDVFQQRQTHEETFPDGSAAH
jgi:hypothetical protein